MTLLEVYVIIGLAAAIKSCYDLVLPLFTAYDNVLFLGLIRKISRIELCITAVFILGGIVIFWPFLLKYLLSDFNRYKYIERMVYYEIGKNKD